MLATGHLNLGTGLALSPPGGFRQSARRRAVKRLWVPYFLLLCATPGAFSCSLNRGNRDVVPDKATSDDESGVDEHRGRARLNGGLTPTDQGENAADVQTTQQIRRAILGDDALSFSAKNVQVITFNGKVTLRGPVKTDEERARVGTIAANFTNKVDLDNQLEVTH
jgi:hypothetical protein